MNSPVWIYESTAPVGVGFEVVARQTSKKKYTAWVYLGQEIVWEYTDKTHKYDGMTDFANYTLRKFALKLAGIIKENT